MYKTKIKIVVADLMAVYLKQVKDISSIQTVVAQPVQQFHLSARREILKGAISKWVGLPFFQFPPVADDVVQVTAKCLGAKRTKNRTEERQRVSVALFSLRTHKCRTFCAGKARIVG